MFKLQDLGWNTFHSCAEFNPESARIKIAVAIVIIPCRYGCGQKRYRLAFHE